MKQLIHTQLLLAAIMVSTFSISNAQKWHTIDESSLDNRAFSRLIVPQKYDVVTVDFASIEKTLASAPERFRSGQREELLLHVPVGQDKIQTFAIERSDVFHPDLASRYPRIQSYTGVGITEPGAVLKLSISHKGIAGMILSSHSTIYIDTYAEGTTDTYIVYDRKDFYKELEGNEGQCAVENDKEEAVDHFESRFGDCQLRKYRLALACTGEYASFHGGNVPDVLAEYNASMNRVNGIYEKDFGITMELIANTDELIYLNGQTDPYTNNNGGIMLGENQATIDNVIGFDNYDIGHVYSTGGGGIASLRSPCTNRKARGVTGLNSPTGDPFWVDYVSHEIGHQFGGNHTYNNSCGGNRNDGTAFEPGSGTTIMSYAGICSPNVENRADDYFHTITLDEVANFVVAGAGSCGEIIDIQNTAPEIVTISASGLTIPASTPFELTAEVLDADGDAVTYCWEQMDNELMSMPPSTNATGGPMFRTYNPSPSPSRLFPRVASILNGANGNTWERLPSASRTMNFTLSVRDNHAGLGCTDNGDVAIEVTDQAGPFLVTSQNTTEAWSAGEKEVVTWDVANTDVAPVSCGLVDLLLSIDGGVTFPIVLAENIQNDGSEEVTAPFQFSEDCRVMVKCATSIFFDINDADFTIVAPFGVAVSPTNASVCADQDALFDIDLTLFSQDAMEITFTTEDLPIEADAVFSEEVVSTEGIVTLTVSNLTNVPAGSYPFTIISTSSDMLVDSQSVVLNIAPSESTAIEYLNPADAQLEVSTTPTLSWETVPGIGLYEVEMSTNPNFEDIVFTVQTTSAFAFPSPLDERQVYYWRVRQVSDCFAPMYSATQSFQVGGRLCSAYSSEEEVVIGSGANEEATSTLTILESTTVSTLVVSLDISHDYIGDISATLTSPDGTTIQLFDRPGVPSSTFGCDGDNMVVSFSDDSQNSADIFESTCDDDPAITGSYQAIDALSVYEGMTLTGDWVLTVFDAVSSDGGSINGWTIENCITEEILPATITNNATLLLTNVDIGDITSALLSVQNTDPTQTTYTMRTTPALGSLQIQQSDLTYRELGIGDQFSQSEIDAGIIRYQLAIIDNVTDEFLFDVVDDRRRYSANLLFNIVSVAEGLSATGTITSSIDCFGAATGEITITAQGGATPYTYSIDGEDFVPDNVFPALPAGSYTAVVRDANGEEFEVSTVTLVQPSMISINTEVSENQLTANASGGTGTLTFSLDNSNFSETNVFDLLNGQTYTVYVKDENGCVGATDVMTHYNINAQEIAITDNQCFGLSEGSIEVIAVDGGLPPYTYTLDDNMGSQQTNDDGLFTDLPSGAYTLEVTDALEDDLFSMLTIVSPPAIELVLTVVEDSIFTMATGGTGQFTYSLDDVTYEDVEFFVVADGSYFVYVRDSNGCTNQSEAIVISTSIADREIEGIKVYPNPADQYIEVAALADLAFEYRITDMTGRLISRGAHQTNLPLMVNDLTNGLYIITVKTERGQSVRKFAVGR